MFCICKVYYVNAFMMKNRSHRSMLKYIGPSIEPCGTPYLISFRDLYIFLTLVLCIRFIKGSVLLILMLLYQTYLGNKQIMRQAVKGFGEVSQKCHKFFPGQHYPFLFSSNVNKQDRTLWFFITKRWFFERMLLNYGDTCLYKYLSNTFDKLGKMLTRW